MMTRSNIVAVACLITSSLLACGETTQNPCTTSETIDGSTQVVCGDSYAIIPDGEDGRPGKDGANGTTGLAGQNGPHAVDGTDGTDGTDGVDGTHGRDGRNGTNGRVVLVKSRPASEAECSIGGSFHQLGQDTNRNNLLEASEVQREVLVCDGQSQSDGADAPELLIEVTRAPISPTECSSGGQKIEFGFDADADSILDPDEVDASLTQLICDNTCPEGSLYSDARDACVDIDVGLSAGDFHNCYLDSLGELYCWGDNSDEQMGMTSVVGIADTPRYISAFGEPLIGVALGENHTCAINANGAVKCIGDNSNGELGPNSTIVSESSSPIDVPTLDSGVTALASGQNHTCALTDAGEVKCWGALIAGATGSGSTIQGITTIAGLGAPAVSIGAGDKHTCALLDTGRIKCWGRNFRKELGDNTSDLSTTPVDVIGIDDATGLALGRNFSCASTQTDAKCWGSDQDRRLGRGVATGTDGIPAPIAETGSGIVAMDTGGYHGCYLDEFGHMRCWGDNTRNNQVGDDADVPRETPVTPIGMGSGVVSISTSLYNTCALKSSGHLYCWGSNAFKESGLPGGSLTIRTPQLVTIFDH